MKTIDVNIPDSPASYSVFIGEKILENISGLVDFNRYSSVVIFTDSNVLPLYGKPLMEFLQKTIQNKRFNIVSFTAGEKNKNVDTVQSTYQKLIAFNSDRKTLMINLGGGVVSDIGGFIASTYQRGIQYINIPTTLEAMVDASVGGKTGINFKTLKNYIGLFSSPVAVVADVETLSSLPPRAFVQGYAEGIKHGLIADQVYFQEITKKKPTEYSPEELIRIISRSVEIKRDLVQIDFHESSQRKLLNFGHTIGHAVESLSLKSEHPLFHGEAVAIGMVGESYLSKLLGMITNDEFDTIETAIQKAGLPTRFSTKTSHAAIQSLLLQDKKNSGGVIQWTLLEEIGKGTINIAVDQNYITETIEYIR